MRIGGLSQRADDLRVVGDDLVDAVVGDAVRVGPAVLDGVGVARPAGRDGVRTRRRRTARSRAATSWRAATDRG